MTIPREGMDHALYRFSVMPDRAPLRWPGGLLAGTVFLYLEHWELLPADGTLRDPRFRDPFGDFRPDYRTYTWREYGNRIGIFRLMEVLDRVGLKVTVAANTGACDRYPYLVDELLKRGLVEQGDWVILTKGDSYHTIGGTNGMKILHVGDPLVG